MKISVDTRGFGDVQRSLQRLPLELRDKALGPAINKAADKGVAEMNRAIRAEFRINADEVRNSISLRRASAKDPSELTATISIFGSAKKRGRSLNLIHFLAAVQAAGRAIKTRGSKVTRKQLAALEGQIGFLIKQGAGLKSIPGAFIGNHGRTVFIRTGDKRLPIVPLQVIGVSQMFTAERVRSRVMARIEEALVTETDRAVALVMRRAGL